MRATEKPKWMQIGSESYELKYDYKILVKTANWLIDKGHLNRSECPIKISDRAERCIINSTPIHPTGMQFERQHKLKNGLYIERKWNRKHAIQHSKTLLKKYGYDPAILQTK